MSSDEPDREPNARDLRRAASAAKRAGKAAARHARFQAGMEDHYLAERHYGRGSGADRQRYPDLYRRSR